MTVNLFIVTVATEKQCDLQSRVVTKTTKWDMPVNGIRALESMPRLFKRQIDSAFNQR